MSISLKYKKASLSVLGKGGSTAVSKQAELATDVYNPFSAITFRQRPFLQTIVGSGTLISRGGKKRGKRSKCKDSAHLSLISLSNSKSADTGSQGSQQKAHFKQHQCHTRSPFPLSSVGWLRGSAHRNNIRTLRLLRNMEVRPMKSASSKSARFHGNMASVARALTPALPKSRNDSRRSISQLAFWSHSVKSDLTRCLRQSWWLLLQCSIQ